MRGFKLVDGYTILPCPRHSEAHVAQLEAKVKDNQEIALTYLRETERLEASLQAAERVVEAIENYWSKYRIVGAAGQRVADALTAYDHQARGRG